MWKLRKVTSLLRAPAATAAYERNETASDHKGEIGKALRLSRRVVALVARSPVARMRVDRTASTVSTQIW
jgi:hypothetical protein